MIVMISLCLFIQLINLINVATLQLFYILENVTTLQLLHTQERRNVAVILHTRERYNVFSYLSTRTLQRFLLFEYSNVATSSFIRVLER
jgi:hypothetical protein